MLLDEGCSETAGLLAAAQPTASLPLRNRISDLERHLHRLEIPNVKHGAIELSKKQRSREALPLVFPRDNKLMIGDSAIYIGERQQDNHANWLNRRGVRVDPATLAEDTIASIRQRMLNTGRVFSDPNRKGPKAGSFDAITVQPVAQLEASIDGQGELRYYLNTNPVVVIFDNAFLKDHDHLGVTILHEIVHAQQIIDQPAKAFCDPGYSANHEYARVEVDAYRLVYDVRKDF